MLLLKFILSCVISRRNYRIAESVAEIWSIHLQFGRQIITQFIINLDYRTWQILHNECISGKIQRFCTVTLMRIISPCDQVTRNNYQRHVRAPISRSADTAIGTIGATRKMHVRKLILQSVTRSLIFFVRARNRSYVTEAVRLPRNYELRRANVELRANVTRGTWFRFVLFLSLSFSLRELSFFFIFFFFCASGNLTFRVVSTLWRQKCILPWTDDSSVSRVYAGY